MKAVVLVGGEGTRLRPLTETMPKPLLPLANRAFLHRVLDHLAEHGVHEVVLSSPYLEHTFEPFIAERHGDPRITWITEAVPLGTGGAVVNALPQLGDQSCLVLNGDILTDLDLTALVARHREREAVATITLTHVEDARPFGLVATEAGGRVLEFREKPSEPVPGEVNAGTYVLEPAALGAWRADGTISIEREIFPALIGRGEPVFGFLSEAYWMDLGTPEKYLQAHFDILDGRISDIRSEAPLVPQGCEVDLRAQLGRWVVLGEGASIGPDAEVDESVLHAAVSVAEAARVRGSILGAGVRVGAGATVVDCVLGEGAAVPPGASIRGARVSPGELAGGPGDPEAAGSAAPVERG